MYSNHLTNLFQRLEEAKTDAVILNPGPSMLYLTGLHFHLMERPVLFIATRNGKTGFILPELEALKVKTILPEIPCHTYGDNPATWPEIMRDGFRGFKLDQSAIAVEPNKLRYLELNFIQQALKNPKFIPADDILAALRIHKDQNEIALMQKAVEIAEKAFMNTIPHIRAGISERSIAAELTIQMLREGSDPEFPFTPIVASGPNSANPHAVPTERTFEPGDMIVIDWGAAYQGYISDLTRTVSLSTPDPELIKIHEIVRLANQAGREISKSGIPAGSVDRAGRQVIQQAGYGQFFTHRIGHGIGLDAHEDPYMFSENSLILKPGMTFTVEPGIYLPGKGGVRIEDDVVITETGAESLSKLPRDLMILPI